LSQADIAIQHHAYVRSHTFADGHTESVCKFPKCTWGEGKGKSPLYSKRHVGVSLEDEDESNDIEVEPDDQTDEIEDDGIQELGILTEPSFDPDTEDALPLPLLLEAETERSESEYGDQQDGEAGDDEPYVD
jgi:hypothetical protein